MALKFANQKGSAVKGANQYKYVDGENKLRIVGDIVPRYVYWVKGEAGKDIPFECLDFDRDTERFAKLEKNWVAEFYPDLKSSWAYAVQCISDGELKVLNLKKKLWQQIIVAAEDLGDPTDPDTGWDIVFRKVKTGPSPLNVEYQLVVTRCKPRPLTDEERALLENLKSMDEIYPRPTPEAQLEQLKKLTMGRAGEDIDEIIEEEFEVN